MDEITASRLLTALEELKDEIRALKLEIRETNNDGTAGDRRIANAIQELKEVIQK
ncbi:MAG: hypothetical protein H6Q13_3603 [Bacteroidetes bacterium]|nr:hypothetical protein [Bacteroidota bacterium]